MGWVHVCRVNAICDRCAGVASMTAIQLKAKASKAQTVCSLEISIKHIAIPIQINK